VFFRRGAKQKKLHNRVYDTEIVVLGKEGDIDIERLLIFVIKTADRTQNGRRPARAHITKQ